MTDTTRPARAARRVSDDEVRTFINIWQNETGDGFPLDELRISLDLRDERAVHAETLAALEWERNARLNAEKSELAMIDAARSANRERDALQLEIERLQSVIKGCKEHRDSYMVRNAEARAALAALVEAVTYQAGTRAVRSAMLYPERLDSALVASRALLNGGKS